MPNGSVPVGTGKHKGGGFFADMEFENIVSSFIFMSIKIANSYGSYVILIHTEYGRILTES